VDESNENSSDKKEEEIVGIEPIQDKKEAQQKEAVTPEPEPVEDEAKEQQPDGEEPPVG